MGAADNTNPKTEFFFAKATPWQGAYKKLRTIVLACGLQEELKWGVPCYTWQGSNVVLMHGFKEYCALLFHKGALLKDSDGVLIQQTENVQSARQMRFTSTKEIAASADLIKAYLYEAIEVEKAGLKVEFKKPAEFKMAEEFKVRLSGTPGLQKAFEALTPGRQRAYLLYFAAPKLAKTREARVEKCVPQILAGKGLDD